MSRVTSWTLVTSTEGAWEAMTASFERAEVSIDLEQFVFGHDGPFIEKIAPIFKRKVTEGVRVRLLLDAVGSFGFFKSELRKELEEAGIQMVFHKTLVPPSLKRVVPAFLRDHRKLIVIDGKEAHIGGVILEERARSWRDTNLILEGPLTEECQLLFDAVWNRTERMKPLGETSSNGGRGEFYLAGNSYRQRDKLLNGIIVRNIATAKKTIYITTPYFALTREIRRALMYAKERGVHICILLPRRSDNFYSDCIGRLYYGYLLRHNIRIFHYTKSILHAKTIIIDGAWSTLGSCNLDWLSLWLNYELNLVSENADLARELETVFLDDIAISEEVTTQTPRWYGFFK